MFTAGVNGLRSFNLQQIVTIAERSVKHHLKLFKKPIIYRLIQYEIIKDIAKQINSKKLTCAQINFATNQLNKE